MKQQENSGFSLMEVMIAMAVFTIGALGLYSMQINSAMWNTKANRQTSAVLVASQVVEQLMRTPYDNESALKVTDTELSVTDTINKCHADADDDTCHDQEDLEYKDEDEDDRLLLTFVYPPGPDSLIKSVIWIVNQVPDNNNMKQVHVSVRYGAREQEVVNISFLKVNLPKS
ncbi:MAG: prepilin-type N-terminal cleavage/methylation domain-containing protein [Candidatus Electrothrix sp. GM3_4]|nr:prepilin-type N-terminal cleavage/methylation domain-containing protein [Candidatus Electrothrix sp. GM3_4]